MTNNQWLQRGIEELEQNRWFDGYQMILGAYQRALRSNDPKVAQEIVKRVLPLFKDQKKLACNLISTIILSVSRNPTKRLWVEMIPISIDELVKSNLKDCIQVISNKIIFENKFQGSEFLQHLNNIILEKKFNENVLNHLYYCHIGILCHKKDYVLAFESLSIWSNELMQLSPKIRAYLTLAEINAYEIEGCGKYLQLEDSESGDLLYNSEEAPYLEIANRIFRAVQVMDIIEFNSTIQDHSNLINSNVDGLLKALCDGISEVFKTKPDTGLFSLFGR
ncbi:MAG: hypothetical protein ACFFAU_17480 [Candidatus Hodarchaeota archaeon]